MDRRTLLLGLLGGLAAAPVIIAATTSVEAAPLPEALPEPASASVPTEADLKTVNADWSLSVRRRMRERAHEISRRTTQRVRRRRGY